jgi:hypothetical protein
LSEQLVAVRSQLKVWFSDSEVPIATLLWSSKGPAANCPVW